jgi:ElaB/YqjD/DUF883 family membrane-anchored ribosome-binding protein
MPRHFAPDRIAALAPLTLLGLALSLAACQSTYYATLERLGWEKRDLLVERVQDARDKQVQAKEQFENALEEFMALTDHEGGELEKIYDRLLEQLRRSRDRAKQVRDRIDSIENVASALFEEWQKELEQYNDPSLRRASEQQLERTKQRYQKVVAAMHKAEASMEPVLQRFNDQVLFLKHNLNAQAIASLEDTRVQLESDVQQLVSEMEQAIAEATRFVDEMKRS